MASSSASSAFTVTITPSHTPGLATSSLISSSSRRFSPHPVHHLRRISRRRDSLVSCSATREKESSVETPEEVTRKFGLEAGLWKIFTSKDDSVDGSEKTKSNKAKDLLARYGGAYLATSITLSAISFGLCYVLINSGVDVASLLQKIGIQTNETGEKVGTFALAYAAHKAASPIRFPPTVALTPIVAGWLGKKVDDKTEKNENA